MIPDMCNLCSSSLERLLEYSYKVIGKKLLLQTFLPFLIWAHAKIVAYGILKISNLKSVFALWNSEGFVNIMMSLL